MTHPYQTAPAQAFWRKSVAGTEGEDFSRLYTPKFQIRRTETIATAGSCFAQHIGRALVASGLTLLDAEPAPRHLATDEAKAFGYNLYSGRYGNIYTARQLRELLEEVANIKQFSSLCWQLGAGWVDAFRPNVEPEGLSSTTEVAIHRNEHISALRAMLPQCSLFVFTLGMTEAWRDRTSGRMLPVCPGVIAGTFSEENTSLVSFRYPDIVEDLMCIRELLHQFNPLMRILLTVSPVPMTATASGRHVLLANSHSKSTLRAAAEDFAYSFVDVDYFPSYEVVTSPAARGQNFEPNLREVRSGAVSQAMTLFLRAHRLSAVFLEQASQKPPLTIVDAYNPASSIVCEEDLLKAFASK